MIILLFASLLQMVKSSEKGVELKINTLLSYKKEKRMTHVLLIGIPQEGEVDLKVIFKNPQIIEDVPLNMPGIEEEKGKSIKITPSISRDFEFSKSIEWWRDIRILRVFLNPLRKNKDGKLEMAGEVDLKIRFLKKPERNNRISAFEDVYKKSILNYQEARFWKRKKEIASITYGPFGSSRNWVKIVVDSAGVYKVYGRDLQKAGVDIKKINSLTLSLYGAVGYIPIKKIPSQLTEIPIYLHDGGDGKFDKNDYFLFYAKGADYWDWKDTTYHINPYTRYDVYWLTWGVKYGKRMEIVREKEAVNGEENVFSLIHLEKESDCPGRAGILWIWEEIRKDTREDSAYVEFNFKLPQSKVERVRGRILSTTENTPVGVYLNDNLISKIEEMPVSRYGVSPWIFDVNVGSLKAKENFNLKISTWGEIGENTVYLDWLDFFLERKFSVKNSPFFILAEKGRSYKIVEIEKPFILLDVTTWYNPKIIGGWSKKYVFENDRNRILYLISEEKFRAPLSIEKKNPSKIFNKSWKADYLILVPDEYYFPAKSYASYRKEKGFITKVTKLSEIFDAFGLGIEDPIAVKRFLEYVYFVEGYRLKYVMFVGDGTYDFKNNRNEKRPSYFPIYTEGETLNPSVLHTQAACYDSWFVDFDGEGNTPEIVFGRVPARSVEGLIRYFSKVKVFEAFSLTDWIHRVVFLGDDFTKIENGEIVPDNITDHIENCEKIDSFIYPLFTSKKIYLINYSFQAKEKRKATDDLISLLSQGTLFWIFFGHGNGYLLTHEHVFRTEDVSKIHNDKKYFIGFLGTCGAGRFEDTYKECIAEELVRAPEAAVAMVAATKGTSSFGNFSFLKDMLSIYLENPQTPLGLCFIASIPNEKMEELFGDPTLSLPNFNLISLSYPKELKTKEKYSFTFPPHGEIYIAEIFGNREKIHYEEKVQGKTFSVDYTVMGTQAIRLNGVVLNDSVKIEFTLPPNIEEGEDGIMYVIFKNKNIFNMLYKDSVKISEGVGNDEEGPYFLSLKINGKEAEGELIIHQDKIKIEGIIADKNGINITDKPGKGGHRFGIVTGSGEFYPLSQNFVFYNNTDTVGVFHKELELLEETDTLYIWVLDNLLNESFKKVILKIEEEKLEIKDVVVFPTPAKKNAFFLFKLNTTARIKLDVFTIKGRPVWQYSGIHSPGIHQVEWDLRDSFGRPVANGVYLFKLTADSYQEETKQTAVQKGSFIVIR